MKYIIWFWPWQDKEEERWLNEQAQNGLALSSVKFPCTYLFDSRAHELAVYRLDYFNSKDTDLREYMNTRNINGWFFIGSMRGWHYFKKETMHDELDLETAHGRSKKDKYYHMMNFLVGFLPIIIVWFPVLGPSFNKPLFEALAVIAVLVGITYGWISYKIFQRAMQLRKQNQK